MSRIYIWTSGIPRIPIHNYLIIHSLYQCTIYPSYASDTSPTQSLSFYFSPSSIYHKLRLDYGIYTLPLLVSFYCTFPTHTHSLQKVSRKLEITRNEKTGCFQWSQGSTSLGSTITMNRRNAYDLSYIKSHYLDRKRQKGQSARFGQWSMAWMAC